MRQQVWVSQIIQPHIITRLVIIDLCSTCWRFHCSFQTCAALGPWLKNWTVDRLVTLRLGISLMKPGSLLLQTYANFSKQRPTIEERPYGSLVSVCAIFFAFTLLERFCDTFSGLDCGIVYTSEDVAAFGRGRRFLSVEYVHRVNSLLCGMLISVIWLRGIKQAGHVPWMVNVET